MIKQQRLRHSFFSNTLCIFDLNVEKMQYLVEWNGLSERTQVCKKQAQNPRLLEKGSRPIVRTHGRLYQPIRHSRAFAIRLLKRVFVFRLGFEFGSQCENNVIELAYVMENSCFPLSQ